MDNNESFLNQGSDIKEKVEAQKKPRKKAEKVEKVETVETEDVVAVDVSKIENTLVKHNVTEEVLNSLQEFKSLTINGLADKEGYKEVDEKRKLCKKLRVLTGTLCREGREAAIQEQKMWISKEKEITGRVLEVEEYLESQTKLIDDEKQKIKEEADTKAQIEMQKRTARLLSLGMVLQNDNYLLNGHMINALHVKIYSDFEFEGLVAPVEQEAKAIAETKAVEDAKLKEIQDREAAERATFEAEKKAFEEQQRLAKEKSEANTKVLADQQAKMEEEKKAVEAAKIKSRKTSLFALGFSQQHECLIFKEAKVLENDIIGLPETGWLTLLENSTKIVAEIKTRIEKETANKAEADKQAAVLAERKRIEDEKIVLDKEVADKKVAAETEAKRLEALKPDQQKLKEYFDTINKIPLPEFTSTSYIEFSKFVIENRKNFLNNTYQVRPK